MSGLTSWLMTVATAALVAIAPSAWAQSPDDSGGGPSAGSSSQVLELPSHDAPPPSESAKPGVVADPEEITQRSAPADADGDSAAQTPAPDFAGADEYMGQQTPDGAGIAGMPPGVLFGYGPGFHAHAFRFSTSVPIWPPPISPPMMLTPFHPSPFGPPALRFSAPIFNASPAWGPPAGASFYGSPYVSGIPFSHR